MWTSVFLDNTTAMSMPLAITSQAPLTASAIQDTLEMEWTAQVEYKEVVLREIYNGRVASYSEGRNIYHWWCVPGGSSMTSEKASEEINMGYMACQQLCKNTILYLRIKMISSLLHLSSSLLTAKSLLICYTTSVFNGIAYLVMYLYLFFQMWTSVSLDNTTAMTLPLAITL